MKNKIIIGCIALGLVAFTGCTDGNKVQVENSNPTETESANTVSAEKASEVPEKTESANTVSADSVSDDAVEENDDKDKTAMLDERKLKATEDSFSSTLEYIKKQGSRELSIDFSDIKYYPRKYENVASDFDVYKEAERFATEDTFKKIRILRTDHEGATADITYYINSESRLIDKICMEEFCADGRDVTDFYFKDGKLVYAYEYNIDSYATKDVNAKLPGKRCFFANESMTDCYLNDKDVSYKNVSYSAAKLENEDDFIKQEFANLEEAMLNRAYTIYEYVRELPATCKINGYVGDEFGGVLANVKMTITSPANEYSEAFTTNGDGYFEIVVPVNTADDYGIACTYGDFTPASVDDIRITPGCTSYSLGVIYMAEPGQNIHEPNTYLLNANYRSPKPIGNGEYCVTFTYEDLSCDLKSFALNTATGKMASDPITVIRPDNDNVYKYYVTDQRGGHSGNPMTYELSTSRAVVKVYSKDGLVASFQVPVASAGTVWEVFEIKNKKIVPVNNYFYVNIMEPFFR